jgi:hypothetical protein
MAGETSGGIMLPDAAARREQILCVLAWGPDCTGEFQKGAQAFLGAENVAVQVGRDGDRLILVVPEHYVIAINPLPDSVMP